MTDMRNAGLKKRTIKTILGNRIGAWIKSLPEDLQEPVKRDTIVTGGCIASMLLGETVNDIDVYFRTKETTKLVADHYVKVFLENRCHKGGVPVPIEVEELLDVRGDPRIRIVAKSAGVESEHTRSDYTYFESRPPEEAGAYVGEVFDDPERVADLDEELRDSLAPETKPGEGHRPVFMSSNAISLSNKIQVVLRFFGEPDEIHDNYDFVHCTNFWEAETGELTLRQEALEALLTRSLVYRGSRYPVASIIRLRKFISRGWRVNAGQIVKMALQVSNLDLSDYRVLEDQLTGVDVAYFAQVLEDVRAKDPETIDQAYLVEVIDRLFDD